MIRSYLRKGSHMWDIPVVKSTSLLAKSEVGACLAPWPYHPTSQIEMLIAFGIPIRSLLLTETAR